VNLVIIIIIISEFLQCLHIRVEYSYFSCPSNDFGFPSTVTACPACGSTSCSTSSHVTTSVLLCENYIGCQSVNESCISCVFSSTRHHLDSRQTTSQTYSSQSLPLHPGPHCGTPVAETMSTSCHGRTGKWRIEHFPLLHRERMEPAAD